MRPALSYVIDVDIPHVPCGDELHHAIEGRRDGTIPPVLLTRTTAAGRAVHRQSPQSGLHLQQNDLARAGSPEAASWTQSFIRSRSSRESSTSTSSLSRRPVSACGRFHSSSQGSGIRRPKPSVPATRRSGRCGITPQKTASRPGGMITSLPPYKTVIGCLSKTASSTSLCRCPACSVTGPQKHEKPSDAVLNGDVAAAARGEKVSLVSERVLEMSVPPGRRRRLQCPI